MMNYYDVYILQRIKNNLPLPPQNKDSDEYKKFIIEEIRSGRGLPPIKK